jgi:uncharacterized membrane protein
MKQLKPYWLSLILFIVLDYIWLGFVMKDFNMRQLAEIGRIENGVYQLNYTAAIITYFFMAIAVPFFVLPRVKPQDSSARVFFTGALMGLIIYGVFDMTNLAILKNYPVAFVAPDMAWGAFVFGFIAVIVNKFQGKP